jgi:exodeoxyribonuclease V alpha subunit
MESLKTQGVTVMATTIHKLLCPQVGRDGWEFAFNSDCKLPYDFIIVDESSMIDIGLLKSLLDAVKDTANVLFVGDHEQLPPVGKGAPLRDMIKSGVPCGKLTEIRRNAGEIVRACAAIRDGGLTGGKGQKHSPIASIPRNFDADDNLIFCRQAPLQDNTFATIKSIIEFEQKQNESFEPLSDCQIIVALNESSQVSRKALNPLFQDYFNPSSVDATELVLGEHVSKIQKFRRGDKVICTANGYATSEDGKQVYVANGEIGIVKDFAAASLHVAINEQTVHVPTYGDWSESNVELGYTITAHRSQGSEWAVVVVVLDAAYGARMICDRHWIYTAISRAKRRCYLIGLPDTLQSMTQRSGMWDRRTLFAEQFGELRWGHLTESYKSKTLNQEES